MTTSRFRAPVWRSSKGLPSSPTRPTRLPSSSLIFWAYGRAPMTRSWARRNLAAATSFIALVIFWVDSTERIRRLMSRRVAIGCSLGGLDPAGGYELRLPVVHRLGERGAEIVGELLLVGDLGEHRRVPPLHPGQEEFLERVDLVHRHVVEQALRARVDDGDLLLDRQRHVLSLLEQLDHTLAPRELGEGGLVEVRAELGEGGELTELGQVQTQRPRDLAHGLDLGRAAHPRHGEADVDGGPDAGEEEVRLQIDLAIGDRDHVRRDVGGHVAELRLDDG